MIVLDANILIRAVLGRKVRQLLESYSTRGFRFIAPNVAFEDAQKYLPSLLRKRGMPESEVPAAIEFLKRIIEPVDPELYGESEREARERLVGRDENDWPVLATALQLDCDIWSEDQDFFGTGIAVWTTNRIEILLKSQLGTERNEE